MRMRIPGRKLPPRARELAVAACYLPLHADARLTEEQRRLLVAALEGMGGGGGDHSGPGGG
jgi:hypothetical protein